MAAAGSEYSLELDPLVHEIDPKQSSYRILSTKVEIKLKKKTEGIKWNNLEGEDTLPSHCKLNSEKARGKARGGGMVFIRSLFNSGRYKW